MAGLKHLMASPLGLSRVITDLRGPAQGTRPLRALGGTKGAHKSASDARRARKARRARR